MRALIRAFLLGALAIGLVAYALAAAAAVTAQAGGRTLEIALGQLRMVSVVEEGSATVTTFGSGILVVALVGGLVNLAGAAAIRRRSGP